MGLAVGRSVGLRVAVGAGNGIELVEEGEGLAFIGRVGVLCTPGRVWVVSTAGLQAKLEVTVTEKNAMSRM
jgi:hypothetical protein